MKSLRLRTLSDVTVVDWANGGSTVTFGPTHPFARWGNAWPGFRFYNAAAFELLAGPRDVYRTIRDAQQSAGR